MEQDLLRRLVEWLERVAEWRVGDPDLCDDAKAFAEELHALLED